MINVILLLHVVHMSWCMGCMPYCCPLAISDTTSELPFQRIFKIPPLRFLSKKPSVWDCVAVVVFTVMFTVLVCDV